MRALVIVLSLLVVSPMAEAKEKATHAWGIKNVIFDFGGVLVDLQNAELTRRMRALIGRFDDPALHKEIHRFQRGELDLPGFRDVIRRLAKRELSDHVIDRAWGVQIGKVACKKLRLIERLRRAGYKTYALSTTDPLHAPRIKARFARCLPGVRGDVLDHLFEKAFLTYELGLRKPDARIYRKVLSQARIKGNETLFIDDSLDNVLGAQKVGLRALVVRDGDFVGWLSKLLLETP